MNKTFVQTKVFFTTPSVFEKYKRSNSSDKRNGEKINGNNVIFDYARDLYKYIAGVFDEFLCGW